MRELVAEGGVGRQDGTLSVSAIIVDKCIWGVVSGAVAGERLGPVRCAQPVSLKISVGAVQHAADGQLSRRLRKGR